MNAFAFLSNNVPPTLVDEIVKLPGKLTWTQVKTAMDTLTEKDQHRYQHGISPNYRYTDLKRLQPPQIKYNYNKNNRPFTSSPYSHHTPPAVFYQQRLNNDNNNYTNNTRRNSGIHPLNNANNSSNIVNFRRYSTPQANNTQPWQDRRPSATTAQTSTTPRPSVSNGHGTRRPSTYPQDMEVDTLTCHNCQAKGHLSNCCNKPRVCFHCHQPGHLAKDCLQPEINYTSLDVYADLHAETMPLMIVPLFIGQLQFNAHGFWLKR